MKKLDRGAILGAAQGKLALVEVHGSVSSTNDLAKALAAKGETEVVVVAEEQTKGRGRGGHAWYSPPGQNLYFSMVLKAPEQRAADVGIASLVAGVAVRRVVDSILGPGRARIKWPNDIVVGAKKIAGVLVEATVRGGRVQSLVVGVGINVSTAVFPAEIAARATSLALEGRGDVPADRLDRSYLAGRLANRLHYVFDRYASAEATDQRFIEEVNDHDALRDRTLRVGEISGIGAGVDASGALLLARPDGAVERIIQGEIDGFYAQ